MLALRAVTLSLVALLGLAACSSNSGGGTGGTGSSGTGGGGTGGGGPALGQPITAPSEQWTWVPFPDAFCANGASTGIGVNLSTASSRVLLYLEGGGACWNDLTCYTLMTASYFTTGYGEGDFATESKDATYLALPGGFFDRTAAANPFKDYSYVYVPYCTGDIHAGNNVFKYPSGTAHHVGFTNMTAYLKRIVPTFPSADRVIIAGSSAGGLGAAYNWWQAQQYFGSTRVDLIDDSGTPMPPDVEAMGMGEAQIRTTWNLAATFPPGCTGCATRVDAILGFYAKQFPTHRASLLSYVQDSVLPNFYGITTAQFSTGLAEEISTYVTPDSNFQYFTNPGSGHVVWFKPTLATTTASGDVTVQQFVTKMVTDDATWTSIH